MKKEQIDSQIVDAVFGIEPEQLIPLTKTVLKDENGEVVQMEGIPGSDVATGKWVARVASMALSIKMTPKVGNDYLSVEAQMTVDVNTLDKDIVYGIWKDLQGQITSRVYNTLLLTKKQLDEMKKAQ
jgi:hypothetical protein